MALPNKTFWCNYNARNYNSTTLTLPKENGQLFDNDLVFPSAVTFNDDHITISGNKRIYISFNSTSDNIFNRTTSTATITFIAKLAGTNNTWFVSNRDYSKVGWMVKAGTFTAMAYNDGEYNYTFQNNPKIFTWRCGNGEQQYICQSDSVTGTPLQTTDWVGIETRQINFFGGNNNGELWTGDFYWVYISPETLTDAEIQAVIDYNENPQTPLVQIPINKYKLYTSNIQKTYNGSTQINKMYVGNDLVYRALPTTIAPTPTPTDPDMLHFTAEQVNSTVRLSIGSNLRGLVFYKSTDGVNFTSWDGSEVTLSNIGDTLWVYGDNQTLSTAVTSGNYVRFVMTGQISAAGDVTYLLQNGGLTTLTTAFVFCNLFRSNTALISAPALPATTITERCYQTMFDGCTSLTQAPQLPALVLQEHCYQKMFNGCSNLNSVTCLATDISAISCTSDWLKNVAATGTFTKDANMEDWTTGINGIPTGWTVVNY